MEKSIESIWKEGFLKEGPLESTRVVDIYNRKSMHLVDRMNDMFRKNAWFVVILAIVHVAIMLVFQLPVHALIMGLLFVPLLTYGRKQLGSSAQIDKAADSYHFLGAFNDWLKSAIAGYNRIYRWFYPIYILTLASAMWMGSPLQPIWEKVLVKLPGLFHLVGGVPVFWAMGIVMLAILSSIFAPKLYEWDLRTIYGGVFDKLDELLAEMEELRSEVKS